MKFIPKTGLVENAAANPLDKAVKDNQDTTALAQEGILTAAAAETDAINQYSQILELVSRSEPWLGEMVKPTLEDIISEEKKHFAQLSTIVSKLPAFEEEFKAGTEEAETGEDKEEPKEDTTEEKEEVEESVKEKASQEYDTYDLDTIVRIVTEESNVTAEYLYDLANTLNLIDVELYPEQVDQLLSQIEFNPETLDKIEKRIVEEADIEKRNKADNIDSITSDISTLESLLEEGLFSQEARIEVQKAIDNLNELIAD